MKKISIIILLLVFSIQTFAYRVIERKATGGGWFGYNYTNSVLYTYYYVVNGVTQSQTGLQTTCTGAGLQHCPKLGAQYGIIVSNGGGYSWDQDQITTVDSITQYIENAVMTGTLIGTYQLTVQVSGESFHRDYTGTWNYPTTGNLLTGDLNIDRVDVAN